LALPDRHMISAVPQPSAVARMIWARGPQRSATIASSRRRSTGVTLTTIPVLMRSVKGPTLVPGLPSIQACLIARQVVRARHDHKWVAVGDEKSLPPPRRPLSWRARPSSGPLSLQLEGGGTALTETTPDPAYFAPLSLRLAAKAGVPLTGNRFMQSKPLIALLIPSEWDLI
jgi:hypothetical protein